MREEVEKKKKQDERKKMRQEKALTHLWGDTHKRALGEIRRTRIVIVKKHTKLERGSFVSIRANPA